jgi:Family of unknown function (DUF6627)
MHLMWRFSFFKVIAWYLVLAMVVIGITPNVFASFAPSEGVNLSPSNRTADLQRIQKTLEMKMISQRLAEFGLSPAEIQTKMDRLSDQQIHQFALQLDQLKVAGDGGLGIIISLLVIAILVVILVYLLGHRVFVK